MEKYTYKIGRSLAIEEGYEDGELTWSQMMPINIMLDILLLDFMEELSQNN
tara:strand:+ start:388 stop:540 length:153 start_codon:yes stop_codon:yes gene_type:complete